MRVTRPVEEAQQTPALVVLLRPQTPMCEVDLLAFPLATAVPPLDLPIFINVQLPLSPNQPGSEPLYCSLSLLLLSIPLGANGVVALKYNYLCSTKSETT